MKSEMLGSRYSIQEQLGKKPGRYTYLALDNQTQNLVVVKLLKLDNDFEWDSLKLFEREAQILQNLSHRAIPQYLDFFEVDSPDSKGFALVQSYIDAKSLEEQVKTGRTFKEAELKEIAEKLLHILIYLHDRNPAIIHRDIKPSNILLTNRSGNSVGEVYLVDFGSVQNITAVEGGTLTVVGTYGYMSPEHFGGRAVPTSDLYSLGATLIYLATGIHPADLPQKDLQIQFENKTQLSQHFTNWLRKVLEPSQEKRFNSAQVALEALQKSEEFNQSLSSRFSIKPVDTNILLKKNDEKIEIIQPGTGFNLFNFFGGLIYNVLPIIFIPFLWWLIFIPGLGWIVLFFAARSFFSRWKSWLFTLFGTTRLRINRKTISLSYEIFGLKFKKPSPSAREHIIKLEYINSYIKDTKNSGNLTRKNEVPPAIIIWAGNKKYQLTGITETELDWLINELSDWLELPVQNRILPVIGQNDS
ncbi:serine/threonine protein kinase [Plectonema cf. radiosum LEGE 06105]|uniref:Serine/threonine protein kinase n=1 Tax=Plectonema cf. radiosum LEGE 06105 TaxID=945769 RepID=A0A8J7K0T8_9CYAN|nr:serine/threonine-protein kinase [Plectonema radiosum]MBE9214051.1 serine/threonine protein kinase [Plectonema cf. radiosum LEGE 06105]